MAILAEKFYLLTYITDSENSVRLQLIHKITTFLNFDLIHQQRKQPFKAVIWVPTLQSVATPLGFRLI